MKKLFLTSLKYEKKKNEESKPVEIVDFSMEDGLIGYDESLYQKESTDDFNRYNLKNYSLDVRNMVTLKEARVAIEEKNPFLVLKRGNSKNKTEDIDSIFKPLLKMPISGRNQAKRVGFVHADNNIKTHKLSKIHKKCCGLINDEVPIYKSKKFNSIKVGYMELESSNDFVKEYVEVVTKRGSLWFWNTLLLILIILFIVFNKDWTGWKFDKEKLKLFKTYEVSEVIDIGVNIDFNGASYYENNKINLNLKSDYIEGITFKIKLFDMNGQVVYESNVLNSGDSLENVILSEKVPVGEFHYKLECETFKNGHYLGVIVSDLTIENRG